MGAKRAGAHPRREQILAVLHEAPGLGFRELARRTGIPHGCLSHHVSVLRRQGHVWTTRHSPRCLHYPGPRPSDDAGVRVAVVEHAMDDADREIVALAEEPVNQRTILERFEGRMPSSTVQARLYALRRRGLLMESRAGRYVYYWTPVRHPAASSPLEATVKA